MFGITISIIEFTYLVSSVMAGLAMILICNETLRQINESFTKVKQERDLLKIQIQKLESDLEKLKDNCDSEDEDDIIPSSNVRLEINQILVNENRKLHVRCDMLEEELSKTREQYVTNKKDV